MDISKKKSRQDLRAYFKKNSIPTEDNYKELIEAGLNQHDDGIVKLPGSALSVAALSQGHKPILNLYNDVNDTNASWVMSLAVPGSNADGFTLSKGSSNPSTSDARIFIDSSTGHVGIGTGSATHRLTVAGDLSATSADLSTLKVANATTLQKTLSVTGPVTAGSTLTVAKAATLQDTLSVTGPVTANSTLTVTKTATLQDTLSVTGSITANATLTVAKAATLQDTLSVTGPVTANSTLKVAKAATLQDTLSVTGAISAGSTLDVTGAVTAASTLAVMGAVSMNKGLDVQSEPRTKENDHPRGRPLYVTGATEAQGAEIRTSDAKQGLGIGATTIYAAGTDKVQDIILEPKGKVQIKGGLEVSGPMLVSSFTPSATAASPDLTLAAGKDKDGKDGKVNVTGALRANSTLDVTGALTAASATISGAVSAASASVSGAVSAASASVSGNASITGVLTAGQLSLGGQQATKIVTGFAEGEEDVSSLPTEKAVRDHVESVVNAKVQAARPNIKDDMANAGETTGENAMSIPTRHAVKQFVDEYFNTVLPDKLILMWHGDEPPTGWVLCDGTNGTPDLRDKFVLGAGTIHRWKDTGGAPAVALTASQLPAHSHMVDLTLQVREGVVNSSASEYGIQKGEVENKARDGTKSYSNGSGISVSSFGGNSTGHADAHENMPPYYVLAFIMRKRNAT